MRITFGFRIITHFQPPFAWCKRYSRSSQWMQRYWQLLHSQLNATSQYAIHSGLCVLVFVLTIRRFGSARGTFFVVVSAFNMRANFISWRLCSRWVYHRVITGQTVEDKNTFKQSQQLKRNEMKWKIKATTTATTTTNQVFWILVMKRWAN